MRIGIFGGTFDPPHVAHNILAAEALCQLGLDRVLWVLTAYPPHKTNQSITKLEDRLAMVEAAIETETAFELSRVEIDRQGPHYAVDTVHLLHKQLGNSMLYYIMGEDSLQDLPTWGRPKEFVEACDGIAVMQRAHDSQRLGEREEKLPGIEKKLHFIRTPLIDISSHQIRQSVKSGGHFRYYLLPSVFEIVQRRGLYKT